MSGREQELSCGWIDCRRASEQLFESWMFAAGSLFFLMYWIQTEEMDASD